MREISADDLGGLSDDAGAVFGTLVYAPRSYQFQAARRALKALGASYRPELRAWQLTVNDDTIKPLQRLYARTSMALWVVEDGDELTAESFDRFL